MTLMLIVFAAVLAWVIGSIWFMIMARPHERFSRLQVSNRGHLMSRSVVPYVVSGVAMFIFVLMVEMLFMRAGIIGIREGLTWGLGIGGGIVVPWLVIGTSRTRMPLGGLVVEAGYVLIASGVIGVILGAAGTR